MEHSHWVGALLLAVLAPGAVAAQFLPAPAGDFTAVCREHKGARKLDHSQYSAFDLRIEQASGAPIPADVEVTVTLDPFPKIEGKRLPMRKLDPAHWVPAEGVFRVCIEQVEAAHNPVEFTGLWTIEVQADRFQRGRIGPVELSEKERWISSHRTLRTTLVRDPKKWEASFACTSAKTEEAGLATLAKTLHGQVYLMEPRTFGATHYSALTSLAELKFSEVKKQDPKDEKSNRDNLDHALAALLNIYHALTKTASCGKPEDWFSYVDEVHVINGERFIARAKTTTNAKGEDVFDLVQRHAEEYTGFACNTSVGADSLLHKFADPGSIYWDKSTQSLSKKPETASIKTPLCEGNIQVTAARFGPKEGKHEILLDFDIDEHMALLLHFADWGKHAVTHGTDAFEMAELLTLRDRNLGLKADLGFSLIPYQSGRTLRLRGETCGQQSTSATDSRGASNVPRP